MIVLRTDRLTLRHASIDDSAFMLELLNDPAFIQNIGDRGVRTVVSAGEYILNKLVASYERNGFGLYIVTLKSLATPIGICGLVKRESLPDVDIGFAFLPAYRAKGYAYESSLAVLTDAKERVGLKRIAGITNPENPDSIRLLEKLGLRFERRVQLTEDAPETSLFSSNL